MKKAVVFSLAIVTACLTESHAQKQVQGANTKVNGVVSQQSSTTNTNKSSVEGMKRRGTGKMESGMTRNGNSYYSPTGPTNTQGSTSQGSASVPSAGGAKGTRVAETRPKTGSQPKSTKNGTASDGGLTSNGTPTYGGKKVSESSTSGSTGGSKRPTNNAAVQKEARTSDRNVSTNGPQPTGAGKPGTPSGQKAGGNSYPQTGKN